MAVAVVEARMGAEDRCDRCGARAYYRAILVNGALYFCAHHGRKYLARLRKVALTVEDHTSQLDEQASEIP